ncbi:hypothetical protein [Sphingobacterium multivorum]|uniref:hypothetical protein n=1 Tax=Sphingobacterium multivorum TaxID=28454 RepID=UPI0028B17A09|nr:hypothetical protein [Sphingobacterium multivorum]
MNYSKIFFSGNSFGKSYALFSDASLIAEAENLKELTKRDKQAGNFKINYVYLLTFKKSRKMKKIKLIGMSFMVVMATLAVTPAMAQSGHGAAPHGGKMVDIDKYHIEMVKGNDALTFYVLDANAKTLNKPATGSIEFAFENGTKSTSNLKADKNGALIVALPKNSIHTICTVTINVQGKKLVGKFKNEVSAAEKEHGHQH